MVQHKGFTVRVCRRGTECFYPDFRSQGQAYVVAVPDQVNFLQSIAKAFVAFNESRSASKASSLLSGHVQEFQIQVLAPPSLKDICKDSLKAYLRLSIDGRSVGYSHIVRAGHKTVFDGFCTSRKTVKVSGDQNMVEKAVYNSFRFASTLVLPPLLCTRHV
jgi:hypothetical protein